jgi:hypothetical protein
LKKITACAIAALSAELKHNKMFNGFLPLACDCKCNPLLHLGKNNCQQKLKTVLVFLTGMYCFQAFGKPRKSFLIV